MTKSRTIYTKEFKLAVLSQVESGIPIAQVARENGLHPALAINQSAIGLCLETSFFDVPYLLGTFYFSIIL